MLEFDDYVARILIVLQVSIAPTARDSEASLYDDWSLDSFQAFQLIVATEALAGAVIPPPEVPALFTAGDAFDYYRTLVAEVMSAE